MNKSKLIFLLAMVLLTLGGYSQTPLQAPQSAKVDSIECYINDAIREEYFPGAQLVIGNSAQILYAAEYGYTDYTKHHAVDSTTLYDLASCTKVMATTLAVMNLVDSSRLTLNTTLDDCISLPDTVKFGKLTVENLLFHESGFLSGVVWAPSLIKPTHNSVTLFSRRRSATNPYKFDKNYYVARETEYNLDFVDTLPAKGNIFIQKELYIKPAYKEHLDSLIYAAYRPKLRGTHRYSDLNFYFLQEIIHATTHEQIDRIANKIYRRMGLEKIGYKPLKWSKLSHIAPTEYDPLFRHRTVHGTTHDELAALQGGVAGNAGIFASARDVARICAMFLRNGVDYSGNQIISGETVRRFTRIKRYDSGRVAALGFTKVDNEELPYTPESYGHSGFTGTFFWVDPTKDLYIVLLTNSINPTRAERKMDSKYRAGLWELAAKYFGE